jgi:LacI family transcriptional regulator
MKEIALVVPPQFIVQGDHTTEGGMKAMSILAALPRRPSAVVCSNDMTAIGIMRQAFELSINTPRDLSVIGFDDISLAQFMIPPLTTVQMSQIKIAETTFKALIEKARPTGYASSREVYPIKTHLVLRQSTTLAPDRVRDRCSVKPAAKKKKRVRAESSFVAACESQVSLA